MNNNYTTLNKDIGLIKRSNERWDLWFDEGDIVKAEDFHSLNVGIIVACLTSWNYMNRYGNPTYSEFGNRAYQLLKSNVSDMTVYKIREYFMEVLNRMRRVYEVVSLNVSELENEPGKFYVDFTVIAINNELVSGDFILSTSESLSVSFIEYDLYAPYASNKTPLEMDVYLRNEYGGGLEGEILYMYVQEGDSDPIMKIVGQTGENGYLHVYYTPVGENDTNNIHFVFRGNSSYEPCISQYMTFMTEQIEWDLEFAEPIIYDARGYADLELTLKKHSTVSGKYMPMSDTTILISGSDGSSYEVVTDDEGKAKVRVVITKDTDFTAIFDDVSSTCRVEVHRELMVMELDLLGDEFHPFQNVEIDCYLKLDNGTPITIYPVQVFNGDALIKELVTDSQGKAKFEDFFEEPGEYTLTFECGEGDTHTGAIKSISFEVVEKEITYLFEDACDSSDGLSNYGAPVTLRGDGEAELVYDDNSYYTSTIRNTTAYQLLYPINPLTDNEDVYKISFEAYTVKDAAQGYSGNNAGVGLAVRDIHSHTYHDIDMEPAPDRVVLRIIAKDENEELIPGVEVKLENQNHYGWFSIYTNYLNKVWYTQDYDDIKIDKSVDNVDTACTNKWLRYDYYFEGENTLVLQIFDVQTNIMVYSGAVSIPIDKFKTGFEIGITQTWQNTNTIRIRNIKAEAKVENENS